MKKMMKSLIATIGVALLMTGSVFAANVEVATYDELVAALAAGDSVKLTADIKTTDAIITSGHTAVVDLNGNTLTIGAGDNKFNDATNLTIKNGTISITGVTVNGNAIFCLDEYEKTLVTTLTLNNVNFVGNGYSSAYGVFYIGDSSVLNVHGGSWNLANDTFAAGGVFKADTSKATVNITDADMTFHNVRRGVTYAATTIKDSTIAISGDADGVDAEMEHGFNRSPLTIKNSTVTMKNLVGRGITAENGAVNITDNSTVTIENAQEATIDIRNNQTVTIDTTSKVAVDKEITAASGTTVSGTITVDTKLGAVAVIGEKGYKTFAEALTAAKAMTGDVTVEIYEKVTLNTSLSGSYSSITFVGKDTDAEIYLEVQGYITATGKAVNFTDLKLSKSEGGFVSNAGFMNVAFGIYDVAAVNYTNCTFLNGACASFGSVKYTGCTFKRSWDKYGLWAYGNVDIIVDGCTFADYRGIKMFAEGKAKTVALTVKNTDFSAVDNKPAIVLTSGESVILEGNTYSSTGVLELDLDGVPNGTPVTSDVAPTCVNDNGACGVLVDGKIYTTVAQAAEVATSGSTVTLLHDSTESVELAEGVTLNKNGFTADGVTVAQPVAKIGETYYATLADAFAEADGKTVVLIANVEIDSSVKVLAGKNITLDLNGYIIDGRERTNIAIASYGNFTLKDSVGTGYVKAGKTVASGKNSGNTINICSGVFTLESGNIYSINNAILVDEQVTTVNINGGTITAEKETANSAALCVQPYNDGRTEITINGGKFEGYFGILISKNTKLTITDGEITGVYGTGLQGNGRYDSTEIRISGGVIEGNEAGIYHPQDGILEISDDAEIRGGTGIVIKGGDVTISGGTISADGQKGDYSPVGSGFAGTGDALYVEHYDNSDNSENYGTPVATITGGTFISVNANAIGNYANPNNAANGVAELTGYVSGGTFSSDVSALCTEGFICKDNKDGTFGVIDDLKTHYIYNLEQLKAFRDDVNSGNTYAGITVYLADDIDLNGEEWEPIKTFNGNFDGQNHKISNLVVNKPGVSNVGFFGQTNNGEIKNLVVENARITGRLNVGVVAGTPYTSKYFNIKVMGHVEVNGMAYVGGVGGKNAYADWTDITVDVDAASYVKATSTENGVAYRTYVGGVIGFIGEGGHTFKNITSNIKVIGDVCDIGGLFGIAHYGNNFENVTFTGAVEAPAGAEEVGGIAGVWHNQKGAAVTFTDVVSTGTVIVGTETTTGSVVGGAYNSENETAENSGSLIIDGQESWLAIAKIGDVKYTTLQAAIDAAENGETVTLLADLTVASDLNNAAKGLYNVAADDKITIDLNGKTITATDNSAGNFILFYNYGELTVKNGTINLTSTIDRDWNAQSTIILNRGGNLTIESGSYVHNGGADMAITVDNSGNSFGDAYLTVNGGEIKSTYTAIRLRMADTTQNGNPGNGLSVATINGGNIYGESRGIWGQITNPYAGELGALAVTGGMIGGGNNAIKITEDEHENIDVTISGNAVINGVVAGDTADYAITGGTFTTDVSDFCADGYAVKQNADGTYGVAVDPAYGKVAKIGDTYYATLAAALAAAQDGETVELLWAEGNAPIAMNGSVYGNKTVTITGTAEVDWSKGWLFVGRGGAGNGTVIFDGANLKSASNNASTGIHVSGREKNTDNKYDGIVVITNSTVELDYLINRGTVELFGTDTIGTLPALTVKNGFGIAGRPDYETESSKDAVASIALKNGAYLKVMNHNGMGVGEASSDPDGYGIMTLDGTSLFECTQAFHLAAKGSLAVAKGGKVALTGTAKTFTVDGVLNSSGDIFADITAGENAEIVLSGGTYTQDVAEWCAEGYLCAEQNSNPVTYKVGKLPSAEVINLGPVVVGPDGDYTFGDNYYVYDLVGTQKMTTSSEPFDLQIALDFIAKDTVAQAEKNAFGNYTTDFYITIDGIADGRFVADEDCYLAGYYPSFNAWVKIPLTGFEIVDGKVYPVITSAGFNFKYTDICGSVGDFICGIHLSDAVLQENPDLKVKLELGLSKTFEEAQSANSFITVDQPYVYDVEDLTSAVAVTGPDYYTTIEGAIAVALKTGDFVKLVDDMTLREDLALANNLVINLGGKTLTANGKTLAIANSVVTITNGTLSAFTKDNVTLTGNAVLTVTDANVAASFRSADTYYVSQNANGTHSIMLRSAFRVFITMVDGEPRIGFFQDCAQGAAACTLLGATSLENAVWTNVEYTQADDASGASELPLYWVKLNQGADDANVYRFFKIGE